MSELSCEQCRELAPELALGALAGDERAIVIAHLDTCAGCRDVVARLTGTGEALRGLLPAAEPPAGFEVGVLSAAQPRQPRRRRLWLPAAVVLAIALVSGGWALGRASVGEPRLFAAGPFLAGPSQSAGPSGVPGDTGAEPGERSMRFAPLTDGGRQVGEVYAYPGQPSWMYMSLDLDTDQPPSVVTCLVLRRDGSTVPIGRFRLADGYGTWGAPAPVDLATLDGALLVDGNGVTVASARFV